MALLFASVLPVIILALYIYNKDNDKEPTGLLIKLFFGGVGSLFITLTISLFFGIFFPGILADTASLSFVELFFHVFFGVALIEEFSKWLVLYNTSYNHYEFDQFFDMIVYSAFVALGFACFENIMYVYEHGMSTAIIRGLLAVPGHFCDGIFMGYYLSMAKVSDINKNYSSMKKYKFLSLFVPMLLHGVYDFCLFSGNLGFIILFFAFIIVLYVKSFGKIRKMSRENKSLKYRNKFCPYCGSPVTSDYCVCGNKNE
jgi:RsiW-degrading membrane proteinase PrsW (M82 family)